MPRTVRLPMFAIAGTLFGLILLLATLQYRWLGQISGAERERMTATVNARAIAFGQDVDRELTRAYLLFQLDPIQQDESTAAALAARSDRWQATARFPRMIKDICLVDPVDPSGGLPPLRRFNASTRVMEAVAWPSALSAIRKQLSANAPAGAGGTNVTFVMRSAVPAVWPAVPALVVSMPTLMLSRLDGRAASGLSSVHMATEVRAVVLVLDAEYIKTEMLPSLAQQYFHGIGDGFDYQLAVVPTAAGGLVYHSVPEFTPAPETPVDATIDLFQVRMKDFEPLVNEVSRFATFKTTIKEPNANVSIQTSPRTIVVQSDSTVDVQRRIDTLLLGSAAGGGLAARATVPSPHWRLLVKHPSGSLEQAVNAVRRRNLLVSSSILGILGLSVGFLVLTTRRAQDLARQQLEFVATVSHELRTPLAVIRSAADNLADGVINDETRIRLYGELVRREGIRLTDLVEQILEFAGLQSGPTMAARPVAVAALLHDVVASAESTTRAAGITIELDLPDNLPAVTGDEAALRRVFQNLLDNAVKYGAKARWIELRAAAASGRIEVTVSDRGMGIAPADQPKIFDPFYRAPGVVAAQIQGAGLGLSLVKRIVEAHGGQVTLTSVRGQGSAFTVSLPIAKEDGSEGQDAVGQTAAQPS
jgi:two-component system, OmpR family, sensor histidine kinase SenX3